MKPIFIQKHGSAIKTVFFYIVKTCRYIKYNWWAWAIFVSINFFFLFILNTKICLFIHYTALYRCKGIFIRGVTKGGHGQRVVQGHWDGNGIISLFYILVYISDHV